MGIRRIEQVHQRRGANCRRQRGEVCVPLDTAKECSLGKQKEAGLLWSWWPKKKAGGLREKVNNGITLPPCRLRGLKAYGVGY